MKPPTPMQTQIIALIAAGYERPEIAQKLHISWHTVKHHIANARKRVGVNNETHLVVTAIHQGWIDIGDVS